MPVINKIDLPSADLDMAHRQLEDILTIPAEEAIPVSAKMALGMLGAIEEYNARAKEPFEIRIGIHTGPVVAGVIGAHRLFFDVWGDTVNMASRMESNGVVGEVSCSDDVREALADRWNFERRGPVAIKGKGEQVMWLLKGPKEASESATQSMDRLPSTSSEESTSA